MIKTPRAGTKTRAAFDALMTGNVVSIWKLVGRNAASGTMDNLRLYYGLEIEARGGHGGGCRLVGIWVGADLIPLEQLQRDVAA